MGSKLCTAVLLAMLLTVNTVWAHGLELGSLP